MRTSWLGFVAAFGVGFVLVPAGMAYGVVPISAVGALAPQQTPPPTSPSEPTPPPPPPPVQPPPTQVSPPSTGPSPYVGPPIVSLAPATRSTPAKKDPPKSAPTAGATVTIDVPAEPSAAPTTAPSLLPAQEPVAAAGDTDVAARPTLRRRARSARPVFAAVSVSRVRRSVLLRYSLRRPSRLVLVIRGPGPGCAVVAHVPVRGRAGLNRIGIAGRTFKPGTYLVSPRYSRGGKDLARVLVTILPPGKTTAAFVRPRCGEAQSSSIPEVGFKVAGLTPPRSRPPAPAIRKPRTSRPVAEISGQALPPLNPLPSATSVQVSPISSAAAFALVLVTGLALIGIFVCVARELRPLPVDGSESRRDPSVVGRWVRAGLARRGRSAPHPDDSVAAGDVDKLAGALDPQVSDAL